ncbi:MAG: efflux RND transporter periplasmic adaptor subunit [Nitrospirota bacterium]|nr:efflux RND transporter periplasmic adaptor subunit [Nitrospirota bacterium]
MRLSRRTWLYILSAVIILSIGYGFMPKPVLVETDEVRRGQMRVVIKEAGKTRVENRFVVSAPVAGYALRIDLDVGDKVSQGQVMTELEPLRSNVLDPRSRAEAAARVSAAEAAISSAKENAHAAKAAAEFAKKEFDRITQLFSDGLVTQAKLDETETEKRRTEASLRASDFAVDIARHQLEAARTALRYSAAGNGDLRQRVVIKSPVNGRILKIERKSEGVVNEGQALIEIGDLRALEVEADVLSADAVRIRPGMPVIFERWGGEGDLEGKVRVIEPAGFTKISALGVEEQRVLVISDIVSPAEKWAELGDGYRVEASFILWEAPDVLQVPTSALFRYKDSWAVFAVRNNKAELNSVELGYNNGLSAEVISGLAVSDIVITHPDSSIRDGARVRSR